MLVSLAWRNLWRQPLRTGLSLLSMAIAATLLVFMLSLQFGVYASMEANALRLIDGFAQLQPIGYAADPKLDRTIPAPGPLAGAVAQVSGITAAAPRASTYVILANGEASLGAALAGVDPQQEVQVSTLASTVRRGRYLEPGDDAAIVMGDTLAKNLGLRLGQAATVLGSTTDGAVAADRLRLVGLFHSGIGELDRGFAQMPLKRFQSAFAMGDSANVITVSGASLEAVNDAMGPLRRIATSRGLTVLDWGQLQPDLKQAITLDFSTAMLWYISLVIVVVFIVLNALLMAVLERTREFGMLLAIGMQPRLIGRMLWLELVFLALLGNLAGVVIGGGATWWLHTRGIDLGGLQGLLAQWGLPGRLYPTLSPVSALAGPLVVIASVALAGVYPYGRIRHLQPVAAMGRG